MVRFYEERLSREECQRHLDEARQFFAGDSTLHVACNAFPEDDGETVRTFGCVPSTRLTVLLQGRNALTASFDGRTFRTRELVAGEACLHLPHSFFRFAWTEPCEVLHLVAQPEFIRCVRTGHGMGPVREGVRRKASFHSSKGLREVGGVAALEALEAFGDRRIKQTPKTAREVLLDLVDSVRQALAQSDEEAHPAGMEYLRWLYVSDYILSHFNADLSRNEVAAIAEVHPNHLSRLCRKHTGMDYRDFLLGVRLNHARWLLTATDWKLAYVAAQVGLKRADYLIRVFAKHTGMTPGQYRISDVGCRVRDD